MSHAVATAGCLSTRWLLPALASAAAFLMGRWSAFHTTVETPSNAALRRVVAEAVEQSKLLALTALTPTCAWPVDAAPLEHQEWLDVSTLSVRFPHSYADTYTEFWYLVGNATWEESTFRLLRSVLETQDASLPRGVHIDIGAWIGPTSLHAAAFASHVYAFEPDPRAFSELHANVLLNPLLAAKMTLMRQCVSNATGPVTMTGPAPLGSSMSRVHGLAAIPEQAANEPHWGPRMVSWPAHCTSLSDFAARVQLDAASVRLIKIDTEGAEPQVLQSLHAWLSVALPQSQGLRWPTLFVELHAPFWADAHAATSTIVLISRAYRNAYTMLDEFPGTLSPIDIAGRAKRRSGICSSFCSIVFSDDQIDWR